MIVHDLYVVRVAVSPNEADAILIVDPNAVLSLAIPSQLLEPISRRDPEVANVRGGMQYKKLAVCAL
jgi:hypothetical protein